MGVLKSLASGLAGAASLTAVHQLGKHTIPHAPRVDAIGRRAVARGFELAGRRPPALERRQQIALAGDLASNAAYYSLVNAGSRRTRLARGAALGLLAGLGAAYLPRHMGLGDQPQWRAPITPALTIAWYTLGGLVAAMAADLLDDE